MPERLLEPLERLERCTTSLIELTKGQSGVTASGNVVRLEGAGSIWNGLAVGVALGVAITGGAWMVSAQQRMETSIEQAKAYHAAVYMLAPRFAEEIDQELQRQKERETK